MTQQVKGNSWRNFLATCLAIAAVLASEGAGVTTARGAKDSASSIRVTAGSIRRPVAKSDRQSRARDSVRAKALAGKRDPFKVPPPPRPGRRGDEPEGPLPPGVRGLVIGQLELRGIVREDATNTVIAVVTNRMNLAYFLRIHDQVFNGVVSGITPASIHFAEDKPDTDGRVETREVVLKLGSEGREAK